MPRRRPRRRRSEEHTSELQSHSDLVCRLLLEKKKRNPGRGLLCRITKNLALFVDLSPYERQQGLSSGLRCFFFNDTATTEIYTLSLHDALPIFVGPAE